MEVELRQLKRREDAISSLNASIETLNLAENDSSIAPAKVIFGSVNGLLMMIRVCSPPFYSDLRQVHA